MKIKKITLRTVRFFFDEEDLAKYGLCFKDFEEQKELPEAFLDDLQKLSLEKYDMAVEKQPDFIEILDNRIMIDMEVPFEKQQI